MSYNGSGVYTLPAGNPVVTGTIISSTWANTTFADIASALTNCVTKDGQSTPTANIPLGGFKLTGVAPGTAGTDAVIVNQLRTAGPSWAAAGGTADAITATYTPVNASLMDGLLLGFRASAANATTTPTFAPDGLAAHTITKSGGLALTAYDIPAADAEVLVRYNLANTRWELVSTDYPQGTWTPSVGGTATYTTQLGRWTKTGRTIFIEADLEINILGTGSVHTLSGLPFACNNVINGCFTVGFYSGTFNATVAVQGALAQKNLTTVTFYGNTAAADTTVQLNMFKDGTRIVFSGCYTI